MKLKHKVILQASSRLLQTDLTCWNVVEEILGDLYEEAKAEGMRNRTKLQEKPIYQYDAKGNLLDRFDSINDAVLILGVSRSGLHANLSGKFKKCHGYIFKHVNDEKSKKREV